MWFHPLAWKLRDAHNTACEEVCDAVAADYLGSARSYSGTLARIALDMVGRFPAVGGIPMARCSQIMGRLRILKQRIYSGSLARRWVVLSLLIGLAALTGLGGLSLVYAQEASPGDKELARHLLQKMQASREEVKNYKCVALYHRHESQRGRQALSETLRKIGNRERMIQELAERSEHTFEEIRLAIDNQGRGKLERLAGELDAQGKVIGKNDRHISTWDGEKGINYSRNLRREGSGIAMISKERPFELSNRFWQPPAMFGGNFCDALAQAVEKGTQVNIEKEKNGTYRVGFIGEDETEQVAIIDPAQGHLPTLQQAYKGEALLSEYKAKFSQVRAGVWFPVEAELSWFLSTEPNVLSRKTIIKVTDIVINDPTFHDGLFDTDFLKGTTVRDSTRYPDQAEVYVYGKAKKNYDRIVQGEGKFIAGAVTDHNGIPAADVHVRVCCLKTPRDDGKFRWTYSGEHDVLNARTESQGRFAVELEEDGEYNLLFSSQNHAAVIAYDVPIGKRDLKVTLPQGGTVTGRVVRIEKGRKIPVASTQVKAEQSSRSSYSHLGFHRDRKTVTDSNGNFRFDHLRTKMRSIETRTLKEWQYVPRYWKISCQKASKTIGFYGESKTEDVELVLEPDLTPLMGRPLPELSKERRSSSASGTLTSVRRGIWCWNWPSELKNSKKKVLQLSGSRHQT
jgi:hypothetical protein